MFKVLGTDASSWDEAACTIASLDEGGISPEELDLPDEDSVSAIMVSGARRDSLVQVGARILGLALEVATKGAFSKLVREAKGDGAVVSVFPDYKDVVRMLVPPSLDKDFQITPKFVSNSLGEDKTALLSQRSALGPGWLSTAHLLIQASAKDHRSEYFSESVRSRAQAMMRKVGVAPVVAELGDGVPALLNEGLNFLVERGFGPAIVNSLRAVELHSKDVGDKLLAKMSLSIFFMRGMIGVRMIHNLCTIGAPHVLLLPALSSECDATERLYRDMAEVMDSTTCPDIGFYPFFVPLTGGMTLSEFHRDAPILTAGVGVVVISLGGPGSRWGGWTPKPVAGVKAKGNAFVATVAQALQASLRDTDRD
jgi:hypothetical protein